MAVLMQTEVNAVPESAKFGISLLLRIRKSGTTLSNHGFVATREESHFPVSVSASFLRL
jgi:hypothetical protein